MTSRGTVAIALVSVCVLSAGMATGATLLLGERGPAGAQGPAGPSGPQGEGADEALSRVEDVESQTSEVAERVEELQGQLSGPRYELPIGLESTIFGLERDVSNLESKTGALCRELSLIC